MTTETMYEIIHEAITGNFDYDKMKKVENSLLDTIMQECNKKAGKNAIYKAFMRIVKNADGNINESFRGVNKTDKFIEACDSYHGVRLNAETAPAVPDRDDMLPEYPHTEQIYKSSAENRLEVIAPEIADVKFHIKTKKHEPIVIKTVTGIDIYVDPKLLLDILECLPDCKIYASERHTQLSNMYVTAENGCGILCPIRPKAVC